MIVVRLRSNSEYDEMMRKVKKMHKFTKELMEKLEDCCEEYEDDDDADYREEREDMMMNRGGSYRGGSYRRRMRRGM
jgi:hypothetical protein